MKQSRIKMHLHIEGQVTFNAIEKGQSDECAYRKKSYPSPHRKHKNQLQMNFLTVKGKNLKAPRI